MANIRIRIVQEQHFIEGDRFFAYLESPDTKTIQIVACNVKPNELLSMCEKLDGLKIRLEQLGNTVEVRTVFRDDPNFESREQAEEYLENKGE